MEPKIITEQMREQLRKPLPKEAISQHPTKKYLSTIKAIYVVERLNDVFGIGKWKLHSEVIDSSTKHIVVKAYLFIPEYEIELDSFGGNDNADLGDAYKGAVTDALTKMASMLEIGIDVFKGYGDKKAPEVHEPTTAEKTASMLKTPIKDKDMAASEEKIDSETKDLIYGARTQKDLVEVWNSLPYWHTSKDFGDLMSARKKELAKPQTKKEAA